MAVKAATVGAVTEGTAIIEVATEEDTTAKVAEAVTVEVATAEALVMKR
jgi:hypothetical protein